MTIAVDHINAISLFVEDLQAAKAFYVDVFGVDVIYEDESAVAVRFENLILNLLRVESAQEIVAPGRVAARDSGSRFQFAIWVPDVDAVCNQLRERGVKLLAGPVDRAWNMRTANFVDPAGHSWEIGQRIESK
jgi:catechol 2,3-dioxygenase-like lactoylglutathione lyase family enzyme